MTVEREVARLAAIVESALGPDGSLTSTLKEVKEQLRVVNDKQGRHSIQIDRLEQNEKRRTKWIGAALTAWIGLVVAAAWEKLR